MEGIRETLHAFRVDFDTFFLEGSLHEGDPSPMDLAFDRLREQGHLYESDGALWLRTTEFGDDKDRVLRRSTGAPTYFAADVAYQEDKFRRGFDKAIYVLGADHHGYVARLKAIASTLGEDPDRVEVPILQFVHIVEGGEKAKMSKRAGDFVRLSELIERIGVDATRWFMLSRSHDSTIDLDLELAAKQDPENPVYYVQMMHARIAGIFRQLPEGRVDAALSAGRGGRGAQRRRARAHPQGAGVPARGARGGRAARAAPDRELRAGARPVLRGLLPRLARARRAGRGRAVLPDRAERGNATHAGRSPYAPRCVQLRSRCDHRRREAARPVHPRRQPWARALQRAPERASSRRSQLRACAETFAIIAEEGRATRSQAQHVVGGFKQGGDVVIYVGTQDQLLSVTVSEADFASVREAIARDETRAAGDPGAARVCGARQRR